MERGRRETSGWWRRARTISQLWELAPELQAGRHSSAAVHPATHPVDLESRGSKRSGKTFIPLHRCLPGDTTNVMGGTYNTRNQSESRQASKQARESSKGAGGAHDAGRHMPHSPSARQPRWLPLAAGCCCAARKRHPITLVASPAAAQARALRRAGPAAGCSGPAARRAAAACNACARLAASSCRKAGTPAAAARALRSTQCKKKQQAGKR